MRCLAGCVLLLAQSGCHAQGDASRAALERPAHFRVTRQVVNPEVPAFTATTGALGNASVWTYGGFETPIVRDAVLANRDSADEIHVDPVALSHWDIFTERLLDGAELDVWRIVNGTMRLVRSDRVAAGGAHLSGWWPAYDTSQIIAPDRKQFRWRWSDWNGPNSTYYFCLRSVDGGGQESPCSATAEVQSPADLHRPGSPADATVPFVTHGAHGGTLAAPVGFKAVVTADGGLQFSWDASTDPRIAGHRLYRSDYAPEHHTGYYLALAGRATSALQHIHKGDWVMWRKKLYQSSPRDFSLRAWNSGEGYLRYTPGGIDIPSDDTPTRHWELARHPADSPVDDHGETYLRLTLGAGEKARVGLLNYGGTDHDWFHPLKPGPWGMSSWIRQEPGGAGKAQFLITGPLEKFLATPRPRTIDVGDKWKMHFENFKVEDVVRGVGVGWMGLEFTGPATFCIDNFNIGRGDVDFLALEPEERRALRDSGMRALRTHMFFPAGQSGYDFDQFTNTGGAIFNVSRRTTLPQLLAAVHSAQVAPWLQMPLYFRPEDWRALTEYLAAPYDPKVDHPADKPWAYKRYAQGHPQPWTDEFDQLFFELGNETWNRTFQPWNWPSMRDAATGEQYTPGAVYGMFQENVIQILKSSPWWKSAGLERKVRFVLGGWIINEEFSFSAARYSPSSDYVTGAAYNGGWDWGDAPRPDVLASYFEVLNDVSQSAITTADVFQRAAELLNRDRVHKIQLGTYEGGPGYAQNGLNNQQVGHAEAEAQEKVMKSLAAGTSTLDAFLARAYRGFTLQNYFTFEHGVRWTSHQTWWQGGQAWPAWKLLELFNHQGTGAMLKTETLSVPTWPLPDMPGRAKAAPDAPLVGMYALRRGSRFMLFLTSRKVPGYPLADSNGFAPVDIELPFQRYGKATLYRTVGHFNDNNLVDDRVGIEHLPVHPVLAGQALHLGETSGTDARGLAPGSTLLYVFEDTDLP